MTGLMEWATWDDEDEEEEDIHPNTKRQPPPHPQRRAKPIGSGGSRRGLSSLTVQRRRNLCTADEVMSVARVDAMRVKPACWDFDMKVAM